jgi:hypothetical protein
MAAHVFDHVSRETATVPSLVLHAVTSSNGFTDSSSRSGSASNARSSFIRSHIERELTFFGAGIRLSLTITSKWDGETPTYAADSTRDNPRGGSDDGNMSPLWLIFELPDEQENALLTG